MVAVCRQDVDVTPASLFLQAFPELGPDVISILLSSNPAVIATPPGEVRGQETGRVREGKCMDYLTDLSLLPPNALMVLPSPLRRVRS